MQNDIKDITEIVEEIKEPSILNEESFTDIVKKEG